MAKKQKDPIALNHDGKEYTEAELRDIPNAHRAYLHILNINRKIENSVFNHEELQGSKKTFDSELLLAVEAFKKELADALEEKEAEVVAA